MLLKRFLLHKVASTPLNSLMGSLLSCPGQSKASPAQEEPLWWPLSLPWPEFVSPIGPKLQCWWM